MNKIILVGAFHETVELCIETGLEILGIIDNSLTDQFLGYPILGTDSDAVDLFYRYSSVPIVLVPDPPLVRSKLFHYYNEIGFQFKTVISPSAKISKTAEIGRGCLIQHGVNVSSSVILGDFVKLNTFANIMHDCNLESFTTVAPNAVLLGSVTISDSSFIGANATVLPGKRIGSRATVGAAAVVTKDVEENTTVAGNPARVMRKL